MIFVIGARNLGMWQLSATYRWTFCSLTNVARRATRLETAREGKNASDVDLRVTGLATLAARSLRLRFDWGALGGIGSNDSEARGLRRKGRMSPQPLQGKREGNPGEGNVTPGLR